MSFVSCALVNDDDEDDDDDLDLDLNDDDDLCFNTWSQDLLAQNSLPAARMMPVAPRRRDPDLRWLVHPAARHLLAALLASVMRWYMGGEHVRVP